MMYVNKKRMIPFKLMEFEEGVSGDNDSSPEALPNFQVEE